jgi:hypothetical protein
MDATPQSVPPRDDGWSIRDAVPYPRRGHVAVLDEAGDRTIVYGGSIYDPSTGSGEPQTDLWSVTRSDSWIAIAARGEGPGVLSADASSVYDVEGQRMIVVNFPVNGLSPTSGVGTVFALELVGHPTWHRFCSLGTVPVSDGIEAGAASLLPDGLLLSIYGSAFRFGLGTPYCDSDPR